jgi:GAF domain-containing protein/HAMP domain-containing protein
MTVINPSKKDLKHVEKPVTGMRFSIRTKITVWVGVCIALVALVLIGYSVITLRQISIESATREASSLAAAESQLVQNQLDLPLYTARAVAQFLSTTKDPSNPVPLSRDQVNGMLRTLLVNNPSFLGTYTLWEPNEFDGQDAIYAGAVAHDATGRFIPYWVRNDDGIIHVEALAQYETPGVGDWYLQPRSTKKEITLAPLIYPIQGKDVVMASFVVPIIQEQKFYGIAGVDAPIGFVQQIVDKVDLYDGTTNAVLFSDTGTLIAVRQQPELTNQPANLIYPDFDEIEPQLGSAFTRLSADGKYLQIFSPIDIGDSGTHWVVGLIIPFEKITAPATSVAIRQVTIGTALIVLALVFLWFLAGQIVRPIQVLTNAAQSIAQGKWDVTADVHSNDEAEVLANTFNLMAAELRNLFGTLEQRVEERTQALSSVAEVGTAASTILDIDILLQQVVDLAKERFGLYHAHIYLLNDAGNTLILSSGAGSIGQQMVAEGRSIPLDREQSLVARAARDKKGVTVNDVTLAPDFLPNPLLPATRSELAVPMLVGDHVIGVFDVQSEIIGRFTDADIAVQTTLAAQVASAVQNARSYTEIQRNQAQLSEALSISRLANWEYDFYQDIFTFNDHFYSIFRTTVEKVGSYKLSSAEYASNFVHPEDAVLVGTEIQRAIESKDRHYSAALEHRIIFENGEIGYISVRVNVDRDENGKIIRWYGANQDVTERRRLEELNRQRARQQEAINQITQKIQSASTIEDALQVAARELGHALGRRQTMVTLEPSIIEGYAAPAEPELK